MTEIRPAPPALERTARALGRILDLDPAVLRADTPLADMGCDAACVLAFCEAVAATGPAPDARWAYTDLILSSARTVGELALALQQHG